jgi:hypothetical protein
LIMISLHLWFSFSPIFLPFLFYNVFIRPWLYHCIPSRHSPIADHFFFLLILIIGPQSSLVMNALICTLTTTYLFVPSPPCSHHSWFFLDTITSSFPSYRDPLAVWISVGPSCCHDVFCLSVPSTPIPSELPFPLSHISRSLPSNYAIKYNTHYSLFWVQSSLYIFYTVFTRYRVTAHSCHANHMPLALFRYLLPWHEWRSRLWCRHEV